MAHTILLAALLLLATCSTASAISAPATVNDGTGADIAWLRSTSAISGNWSAVGGVNHYEACVATAVNCGGTVVKPWTTVAGTTTTRTFLGLTLTEGTTYRFCVRAVDGVGGTSTATCSNGQRVDTQVSAPTSTRDGPVAGSDIDWVASLSTIAGNWTAATDAVSGVARYEYCVSEATDCGGTVVRNWTTAGLVTTLSASGLSLTEGQAYFWCTRTVDVAGNVSGTDCSDGDTTDVTAPADTLAIDGLGTDIDTTKSAASISGNFYDAFDNTSGVASYEYCVSTAVTCAGTVVKNWTNIGLTQQFTVAAALTNLTWYYMCVRTYDGAGNVYVTCSDGQQVNTAAATPVLRVDDSLGVDLDWTKSSSQVSATWTSVAGATNYDYCISSGANCTGTIAANWTSVGTSLSMTRAGLSLVEGSWYSTCVRVTVGAASNSMTCSDGFWVDISAPLAPTGVSQPQWQATTTQMDMSWWGASDAVSDVSSYRYCISTGMSCTGTIARNFAADQVWWATDYTATGLTLVEGTKYYLCVKSVDRADNLSATMTCAGGTTPDVTDPTNPTWINDGPGADIDFTSAPSTLTSNWATGATDGISGMNHYDVCYEATIGCPHNSSPGPGVNVDFSTRWTGTITPLYTEQYTIYLIHDDGARVWIDGDLIIDEWWSCCTEHSATIDLVAGVQHVIKVEHFDSAGPGEAILSWSSASQPKQVVPKSQLSPPGGVPAGTGLLTQYYNDFTLTSLALTRMEPQINDKWGYVDYSSPAPTTYSATGGGMTLMEGTTYYACVISADAADNHGYPWVCSDGVTVDLSTTAPATLSDGAGADITYTSNNAQLKANWSAVTDNYSGLNRYEVCISTLTGCAGTVVQPYVSVGTATTYTRAGAYADGMYYTCVRTVDAVTNTAVGCTNGQIVDTTPAAPPASVNDGVGADIDAQASDAQLDANWAAATDASGIDHYEYCVGTTTVNCSAKAWTATVLTSVSISFTWLTPGQLYHTCVRAYDVSGQPASTVRCSDGVTVAGPSVTTVTASSAPQGRKGLGLQVTGLRFRAGDVVSFAGGGITVTSTTLVSPTRIDVTVDVAGTATVGARNVAVLALNGSGGSTVGAFTVTTPTLTIGLSTLGYDDAARTTVAPFGIGFGTLTMGVPKVIGVAGSGQVLAGAAVQVTRTSDTDTTLTVAATAWSAPGASIPAGNLGWKHNGVSEAWTPLTTGGAAVDGSVAPGTTVGSYDLRIDVPGGQTAGAYSGTLTFTLTATL